MSKPPTLASGARPPEIQLSSSGRGQTKPVKTIPSSPLRLITICNLPDARPSAANFPHHPRKTKHFQHQP
ncbi:MAG: hypothetical protein ABSE48_06830, partial [Verrucomicrobiota bacterium]